MKVPDEILGWLIEASQEARVRRAGGAGCDGCRRGCRLDDDCAVVFLGAALAAEIAGDPNEAVGRAADALHRLLRRGAFDGPRGEEARLALPRVAALSVTFTEED